jgi:hypothetical protein
MRLSGAPLIFLGTDGIDGTDCLAWVGKAAGSVISYVFDENLMFFNIVFCLLTLPSGPFCC